MSSLADLFSLVINLLILGVIAHWILGFLRESSQPELVRARELLDRIFNPMLEIIRNKISPLTLSDGRAFDLSPLILIVVLALTRRLIFFIF